MTKKNIYDIKSILILQGAVMIYTLAGVAGKFASGYKFLSMMFFICYGIEILLLGLYALIWQQIIKKYDLTVAYANRAVALLWSMVWALIIFHENVSMKNIVGAIVIMAGIMIVNTERND